MNMYIRWNARKLKSGGRSYYARLVKCSREIGNKPRQKIIAYLGKLTFLNGGLVPVLSRNLFKPFRRGREKLKLNKSHFQQLLWRSLDKNSRLSGWEKIQVKREYIFTKSVDSWTDDDLAILD